ncbi:MAG: hypothetical protein KDA90_05240 [Planctomycetaceae bacterium]|nr:hypothetical protein [Planctomycetaceae bacterium]
MDHSYEEIRNVVLDILAGREKTAYEPSQFQHMLLGIGEVLERREGTTKPDRHHRAEPSHADRELFPEVFWDLFRQGVITLGLDDSNREFPFFKVSQFGKRILEDENTYFFHDRTTYTTLIKSNVPHINDITLLYLQEAMQSFKSGCMLAATVMLGVASEHSFLLLLEAAEANGKYGARFASAAKENCGDRPRPSHLTPALPGDRPLPSRAPLSTANRPARGQRLFESLSQLNTVFTSRRAESQSSWRANQVRQNLSRCPATVRRVDCRTQRPR